MKVGFSMLQRRRGVKYIIPYQNTPLIPDIAKRMECVSKQIAEQIEFRHVQNLGGLLAAQAQHQNMTYLRLKE